MFKKSSKGRGGGDEGGCQQESKGTSFKASYSLLKGIKQHNAAAAAEIQILWSRSGLAMEYIQVFEVIGILFTPAATPLACR